MHSEGTPEGLASRDEARHAPPADADENWSESYYLDFASADGQLGGYVRIGLLPRQGVAWYWGCVVGEGRPLLAVVDHGVPLPREDSLEIRTSGLWADHVVETPWDHFSLGLEAFALAVDDPNEMFRAEPRGDRVPLGFELDFDTVGDPPHASVFPYRMTTRYEIPCRVHGEILIGDETIDFEGVGQRDHSWGPRDWWAYRWMWSSGAYPDGSYHHGLVLSLDGHPVSTGYAYRPSDGLLDAGDPLGEPSFDAVPAGHPGPEGAALHLLGDDIAITPLHWAPVRLESADGRLSHFARALSRYDRSDGQSGYGWTEWNLPR